MEHTRRPSILLITAHDIGRHLGCYGVTTVRTPCLDALAAQGSLVRQAFCSSPSCSPSRSSIFTGRWPHSNGVMGLAHSHFAWDMHDDEQHLASILRGAGYSTVGMGVIHEARRIERLGFDRINPFPPGKPASSFVNHLAPAACAALTDLAGAGTPFYLQVGFVEPHRVRGGFGHPPDAAQGVHVPPYLVDDADARADLADFQGAIKALDHGVGLLLDTLDRIGAVRDTIVVFTADHGIPFPRAKCSLYDPGLEVAMMMRWPGGPWRAGAAIDGMVSNVDLLPTLLEEVGIAAPSRVQGLSFAPALRGRPRPSGQPGRPNQSGSPGQASSPDHTRREIFAEMTYHDYCDPRRCLRTESHKLIVNFTAAPFFMDPSQAWRRRTITTHPDEPAYAYHEPVELYDLHADPGETTNLSGQAEFAAIERSLLDRLHAWMTDTSDPLLHGIPAPPMHSVAVRALRGR